MRTITVKLDARAYDVLIGHGLLETAGLRLRPLARSGRVFIVTDENVERLYAPTLEAALSQVGLRPELVVLPPGEGTKSFAYLETVCERLLELGIERRDLILALGGGVIGDLAGLAAGLVLRGVDYVQAPTTLLAQVDSSVGGKTAIDSPAGKNLIGLFHQPKLVLADLGAISTLPERERRAGFAEIVKIGLIGDAAFFDWCEVHASAVIAGEASALTQAVATAVAAKARIVEADEREAGPRALLNLGHTFGHALEAAAGFDGRLLHGEAVATGMALAFGFSAELGLCPADAAARVERALSAAGFVTDPAALPGAPFDVDEILALMSHDKKAEAGSITLVLAEQVGRAVVKKGVAPEGLRAFLERKFGSR